MDRLIDYRRDGSIALVEGERELILQPGTSNTEVEAQAAAFFTADE